jgi:signal transduction histidine kinase
VNVKPSSRNDFHNEHFNLETLHFVIDSGLGILNCSESVLRVFSTEIDTILGSNFRDFLVQFHSDWGTKLPISDADVLRGGYHLPWANFTQENVGWNVSSVAVNPDAKESFAIVCVPGPAPEMLSRVTEGGISDSIAQSLQKLFHRVQQSDARFHAFMRLLPGVAFVQNADLGFSYKGSELQALLGDEDFKNLDVDSWVNWIHRDDVLAFKGFIERFEQARKPMSMRFRLRLPLASKTLHLMEIRYPVRSVDGLISGYEGLWLDLTPQELAEKRMQEAAWKESLNEVSSSLTHDFNNILTGIINLADLMRPEYRHAQPSGESSNMDILWESAKRAKEIVQRIVSLNRSQCGKIELLDLKELLQHEQELIRIVLPRDIELSIELPEAALLVRIDKVVLCRILLNFATNARDAIAHKGRVVVSLKQVNLASYNRDDLFSSICPFEGSGVQLLFSDSGHGIDAQNLDRIFCPYFSTKVGDAKSGSGLGLSSISRYAKENGFDFGVRSVVGEGTEMILLMPVDRQASMSARMEANQRQNPTNSVLLEIPLIFGIRAACRNFTFNLQMELQQNKSSSFHLIQNDDQGLHLMSKTPLEGILVMIFRLDDRDDLSYQNKKLLTKYSGSACRFALVDAIDLTMFRERYEDYFDEFIVMGRSLALDARKICRRVRHSALFKAHQLDKNF